jgi:hypothetical protein
MLKLEDLQAAAKRYETELGTDVRHFVDWCEAEWHKLVSPAPNEAKDSQSIGTADVGSVSQVIGDSAPITGDTANSGAGSVDGAPDGIAEPKADPDPAGTSPQLTGTLTTAASGSASVEPKTGELGAQ